MMTFPESRVRPTTQPDRPPQPSWPPQPESGANQPGLTNLSETPEQTASRLALAREVVARTGERARAVGGQAKQAVQQAPVYVDRGLTYSRDQRLTYEEMNANRSLWAKATNSVAGKILRTGVEMIPSPVGYGPGDVLTLGQAIVGRDISGKQLDPVERGINAVAALIPFVPATPVVEVVRFIRRNIEEANHKRKNGDSVGAINDAGQAAREAASLGRNVRDALRNRK